MQYKKSTSFPNHKECTLSGLKLVSLPTLSNYRLQFYINAAEFPASIHRAIFKHSFLNFFDKKDRQVASLQVTTLRDQFVQIVLVDKQGREVTSAWEAITGTSEQLQIALEASNVYFNGRRLLFQMSSKESIKVSQWPVQTPADQSGKPAEWKEIEEFLSAELQQPINLHWEVPSEAKDVSDLSKEQVFVNQVSTLDFPFEGVDYVAFDEQIVEQFTFNPKKSFKQHFNEAILAKIPRIKAEKEHLLMAALVSGFVSYLAILTLLSRMTASTKSSSKRQRSGQEPKQLTDSNVSISPLLHDSRGSLHINNPSSPLSTSQTKSTDILRPVSDQDDGTKTPFLLCLITDFIDEISSLESTGTIKFFFHALGNPAAPIKSALKTGQPIGRRARTFLAQFVLQFGRQSSHSLSVKVEKFSKMIEKI